MTGSVLAVACVVVFVIGRHETDPEDRSFLFGMSVGLGLVGMVLSALAGSS